MKSWFILIAVAVTTLVAATLVAPMLGKDTSAGAPPGGIAAPTVDVTADAPKVEVDESLTYVFPTMAQDTDETHAWMFRNAGKTNLALKVNGTDCSCTIADAGDVPPGESRPVRLKWNSRKFDGNYRKNARIGTNDPRRPEITLTVQGKVYPAVTVIPTDLAISYQTVTNDEDVTRKVAIYSKDRPDMKITRLESSNKALLDLKAAPMTAEDHAALKVDSGYIITATLKPSDKLGAIAEEIIIGTDHPQKPDVRLKVSGKVTGPITVVPEKVIFHDATADAGGSASAVVWVRGRSSAEFTVVSAPPGLDVSFKPVPQPSGVASSNYQMTVRIPPGTPAGKIDGDIVVRTDHPKAAELHIPVDVLVRSND